MRIWCILLQLEIEMKTHLWNRRHGNLWELFIDGERKGAVKCRKNCNGDTVFTARQGGKPIQPKHPIPDGGFRSLSGAKMSVERACGLQGTNGKSQLFCRRLKK